MSDLDFLGEFDPKTEADKAGGDGDYSPLKPGDYQVRVTEADVQATKAGDGKYIYVRLDVEGPTGAGRVVFDRMIVLHPNPTAVEIGKGRFAQLCVAAGFEKKPGGTKALIGKAVTAKLKVEKSKQYGDRNAVQSFKAPSGDAGPAVAFNDDDVPF